MKRARSVSFTEGPFRFSVGNLPPRTTAVVRALSSEEEEYVVHFRPPLARKDARRVHLGVVYCGDRIQKKPLLFSARLLGDAPGVPYALGDELRYELFETHQLRLYGDTIGSAYFAFENNLTAPNYDTHAQYELRVDLALHLMPRLIPGQFLMWFPPDVDPQAWGLRVDPTLIPQRSPLWFKLRGAVSGTKAYTLLGFWVPRPGSEEARTYNFFDKGTFSHFARAAMRLGSLSEERALLAYFSRYPTRHYQEMGWCPAPPGYPAGWGASPDGLLVDPDMTWEQVPAQTAKAYRALDVTRGVCEIKTSRTKCDMAAYFIPQVYMEMISLECVWADVVRFQRGKEDVAHVYRLYRDPALEKELLSLWKYALERAANLVTVVAEEPFAEMRRRLEREARQMKPVAVAALPADKAREYDAYRERALLPQEEHADDGVWGELNERHQKLLRSDNPREMLRLMAAQVQTYGILMDELLKE